MGVEDKVIKDEKKETVRGKVEKGLGDVKNQKDSQSDSKQCENIDPKNGNIVLKCNKEQYDEVKKTYENAEGEPQSTDDNSDFAILLNNKIRITGYRPNNSKKLHKILFQGKDSDLEVEIQKWEEKFKEKSDVKLEGTFNLLIQKILNDESRQCIGSEVSISHKNKSTRKLSNFSIIILGIVIILMICIGILIFIDESFDKDIKSNLISFLGDVANALMVVLIPDIYARVQSVNDTRKDIHNKILVLNNMSWELANNKLILNSIYYSGSSELREDNLYFIDNVDYTIWQDNKESIELDEGTIRNIYRLITALKILKYSYTRESIWAINLAVKKIEEKIEFVENEIQKKVSELENHLF